MRIVDTLMAGAVGTQSFGLDEDGRVFVLDAKAEPEGQPVTDTIAKQVRSKIDRGKAESLMYYMWLTKDGSAWVVATRVEGKFENALRVAKLAVLKQPITAEGLPVGWEGISDKKK
jgi:hypothetical protein